jgi:hypothetical protein
VINGVREFRFKVLAEKKAIIVFIPEEARLYVAAVLLQVIFHSTKRHITMRLTPKVSANITKMVDFYSQFNPSPLSIKQFIDFGKTYGHLFCMHSSSSSVT